MHRLQSYKNEKYNTAQNPAQGVSTHSVSPETYIHSQNENDSMQYLSETANGTKRTIFPRSLMFIRFRTVMC